MRITATSFSARRHFGGSIAPSNVMNAVLEIAVAKVIDQCLLTALVRFVTPFVLIT